MISQEFTGTLFNSIAFHEPFFDRVPAEDFQTSATTPNTTASVKDMYSQPQDSFQDTFPPTYAPFRRMSADTQTSSAESATYPSPDHKPNDKMNSLVLPPIHDLPRPLSPGNSDGSSTRSPQWPQPPHHQPTQPSLHHHHHHQHPHHQHQQPPQQHHHNPYHHQQAPASSHLQQFQFPPIDHHNARRPQLHISPPADHRTLQTASYPTPTSTSTTASAYPSSAPAATNAAPGYGSYSLRRPEDQQPQQAPAGHYRGVAPPPPVVTPATLAAAVGTQTRRRGKLPKPVTEFLKKWLLAHTDHPYPTEDEKKWLCSETGLSMSQVSNWMINARRRILAPAAKANAAAAAAAAAANANAAAITSSATAAAATPYYSRSPPIRTVSGSSADSPYGNGSHYSAPRRESYAPYPMPASRSTNTHQPSYSSPATTYPSSAPPYSAAYHFQSGSASSTTGPATTSTTNPPALSAYASATTLAPFGDSHEPVDRTKSPAGDFAYAPQ